VIIIQVTVLHFTPKVEAYSQRAAVNYFKSFAGKDVYVQVLGYKSYAHLFYTRKERPLNPAYYKTEHYVTTDGDSLTTVVPNEEWLLHGPVDRPVYFICKIQDAPAYRLLPTLTETGAANGFVFFRRK
jgi:hypothetical protein